jgi:methylmalonyl-CoA mutase
MTEKPANPSADGEREHSPYSLAALFPVPSFDEWKQVAIADLKGGEYDKKLRWSTLEGITIEPLYTAADIAKIEGLDALPGEAPYRRGTSSLATGTQGWQIRQDCLLATPEQVNAALRDSLARGANALCIRLDNAARAGMDGDWPEAVDLAGRGGCTISSINGLRIALADIDLSRYPITLRTGGAALPFLAMLIALADERGIRRGDLIGSVEFDPVRILLRRGSLREPIELVWRQLADMARFCAANCPGIRPVIANSHSWHNAGATITQELGYTIAAAIDYLRAMIDAGIDADTAALSIMFSFSVSGNLFPEIAKLRAARILWARAVEAHGATGEHSGKMFLHARTSSFTKTTDDPYNNLVRNTVEAFAAIVGGCDSLYVAPFDETIGRPDAFSTRLARNQQLILREEAALDRVVDPGGGSFYLEALTQSIAEEAWKLVQSIDKQGGLIAALQTGTPQRAVADASQRRLAAIETRRTPIVGVSNYANPAEKPIEPRHIPRPEFLEQRRNRLAQLKRMRHNSEVRRHLTNLTHSVYTGDGNLLELAVAAAAEGATVGEITQSMRRNAMGQLLMVEPLVTWRASKPYEDLRANARRWAADHGGTPPTVGLVITGPASMRRARAEFCRGFFAAGGFAASEIGPCNTPAEAAAAAIAAGVQILALCSDDATYPVFAPDFIAALRSAGCRLPVYIAGNPTDSIEALNAAGVAGYVHIRSNVVQTLAAIQNRMAR